MCGARLWYTWWLSIFRNLSISSSYSIRRQTIVITYHTWTERWPHIIETYVRLLRLEVYVFFSIGPVFVQTFIIIYFFMKKQTPANPPDVIVLWPFSFAHTQYCVGTHTLGRNLNIRKNYLLPDLLSKFIDSYVDVSNVDNCLWNDKCQHEWPECRRVWEQYTRLLLPFT